MTNSTTSFDVTVVGAGLAGCEASFQLAERGFRVRLFEMKPTKRTPAQTSDYFAELVCSNSLRGAALANAVGLLKEELRRCGSLLMRMADRTAVPAGGALAVDREKFGEEMTRAMREHPRIVVENREVTEIPAERPVILATGPLTSDGLAASIAAAVGAPHLAYYDAIAPIVAADSIDWTKVWKQSRWGKGTGDRDPARKMMAEDAQEMGDEAYVNCPFDEAQYKAFVAALVASEKMEARSFEDVRYFEGCLPCEVMAERGERTLAYGPMKPVGLENPHTGRRPYAVVQLRPEDKAATAYNLVGFQTRMKYPEQARVFRMIPGLEEAEFLRFGSVHRNTFVDAPKVLGPGMEMKSMPGVFWGGQVAGVEGEVESAAPVFLCALLLSQRLAGKSIEHPPPTTAFGGLLTHMSREQPSYQPSNITWAHMPPLEDVKQRKLVKRAKYEVMAERALKDLEAWRVSVM